MAQFAPTVRQMCWNVALEPVKCPAARCRGASATPPISTPSPYTTLTTPSGRPASRSNCIDRCATSAALSAGFHTTVFPRTAGPKTRLFMQVKLNGVTAKTNPSSGRYSAWFPHRGQRAGLHVVHVVHVLDVGADEFDGLARGVDVGL